MSAVDEYRKFKKDHPASPCGALGMKADAAIAELEQSEAELEDACDKQYKATTRQRERAEKAEAELRKWQADFRAMWTVALNHERELAALRDGMPALARIAELEASLSAVKKLYDSRGELIAELEAELAALKAENEHLKCCGNCRHLSGVKMNGKSWHCSTGRLPETYPTWACIWKPSRWQARP